MDAAQEGCFRQGKAQNFMDPEHIGSIVEAYRAFEDLDRFAHVSNLEEMASNDFNLNISRYVDTTEPSRGDERGGRPVTTARGGAAAG